MNPRIKLGQYFIQLGRFIESLALVVMRPADLVEFNRLRYDNPEAIASWAAESLLDQELTSGEQDLLAQVPIKQGRLLLLGLGGGQTGGHRLGAGDVSGGNRGGFNRRKD